MKPGERVNIKTHSGLEFIGTVLPGEGIALKLDDGYNIGIDQRNIKSTQTLPAKEKADKQTAQIQTNTELPVVRILHTGGTIASKVDYETGGTSNLFDPKELLALYPELQEIAQVQAEFLANMSSDDMRFAHWNIIIAAVEKAVKDNVAGIIITQGTDTLHYTAAALHYALQGIKIPVVITGSQRSSDRGSSDAFTNLQGATRFIVQSQLAGVFVAGHESSSDDSIAILRGVNARKMHTSRRDTFKSINLPQVARIQEGNVTLLAPPAQSTQAFKPTPFKEDLKIGMLYVHPNFAEEEIALYSSFDGLVLLGTGLGHAPINAYDEHTQSHEKTYEILQELTQIMPVVMTSQCINGRVSMQVYSAGRRHIDAGVLGQDNALNPETTFCKLAHVLSQEGNAKELFAADMDDAIDRVEEGTYD